MKVRVTNRDESLPHQIIIMGGRTTSESAVSCNCHVIGSNGNAQPIGFVTYGEGSLEEIKRLYSNPSNHINNGTPFIPGDWGKTEIVEVK